MYLFSLSWQDIVVGAPQYFDRNGEIGGAVYIYVNQQGKWDGVKPVRLNGSADSMFGIAVENIGDINQDGFPGKQATKLPFASLVTTKIKIQ